MKAKITAAKNTDLNGRLNSPGHVAGPNSTKYSRVPNTDDSPHRNTHNQYHVYLDLFLLLPAKYYIIII